MFHPHIVTIRDAVTTPTFLCLVAEQVHGGTLAAYVRRQRGLPERAAKFLFQQLCMVLSFCHSRGVYVQHLTPEHVVIDWRPGELPVLKLADCGFVHVSQVRPRTASTLVLALRCSAASPRCVDADFANVSCSCLRRGVCRTHRRFARGVRGTSFTSCSTASRPRSCKRRCRAVCGRQDASSKRWRLPGSTAHGLPQVRRAAGATP